MHKNWGTTVKIYEIEARNEAEVKKWITVKRRGKKLVELDNCKNQINKNAENWGLENWVKKPNKEQNEINFSIK